MSHSPGHSFDTTDEARAYVAMVERVKDYAIFLVDAQGIILTWNNAARAMKGYEVSEAVGSFLGMLYTEEEQQKGSPQLNLKMAAENGTFQEEAWRRKKDGSRSGHWSS